MIPFISTFQGVLQKIESANIPYIIVGSIASMIYGEPRLTRDMDIVLDIHPSDAQNFSQLFLQPDFYCPPSEVLNDEIRNKGQFNLLHPATGLKIDVMVKKNTPFDSGRFARSQKIEIWPGFFAQIASPEDVIIKKLEFYRDGQSEKHLRDIAGIITNTS